MIKVASVAVLAVALSGCSGMFTNQARCPFKDRGGCQSVGDVNKMISERKFTSDGRFVQQADQTNDIKKPSAVQQTKAKAGDWSGWNSPTPFSGEPLRTQEVDARMWVAPWQDQDNNYHGSSYVTFVVEKPHWTTLPAKAISNDSYDDTE